MLTSGYALKRNCNLAGVPAVTRKSHNLSFCGKQPHIIHIMLSLISQSISGEKYVSAHLQEYFLGHRRKEQMTACRSRSCSWKSSKDLDKEHGWFLDPEGKSFFPTSSSFAGSVTALLMFLQLFEISLQRFHRVN